MFTLLVSLALADSVTIDTGATLQADLARYEAGGDCQLSVSEGELQGVIVILPCARVVAFSRAPGAMATAHAVPLAPPAVAPVAAGLAPIAAPTPASVAAAPAPGPGVTEVPILAATAAVIPDAPLEMPVSPQAPATPPMPDSIAALAADDFAAPLSVPPAPEGYEIVVPTLAEDAEDSDEDEADDADETTDVGDEDGDGFDENAPALEEEEAAPATPGPAAPLAAAPTATGPGTPRAAPTMPTTTTRSVTF